MISNTKQKYINTKHYKTILKQVPNNYKITLLYNVII